MDQHQQSIKKGGAAATSQQFVSTAENILYTHPSFGDRVVLMYLEDSNNLQAEGEGFYDHQQIEQEQHHKTQFTNDSPLLPLIQINSEENSNSALRSSPMRPNIMIPMIPINSGNDPLEQQQFMALRKSKYIGGGTLKNPPATQNLSSSIEKKEQLQPQHLSMAQLAPLLQLTEQQFDDQVNQLFTSGNCTKKENPNPLFNYQQLTAKANQIRARQYFPVSHSSSMKKHHNNQVRSKSSMNHARNNTLNTGGRGKATQNSKGGGGVFHMSHSNQESMDESSGTNQQQWQAIDFGGQVNNFSATTGGKRHLQDLQKTYQPVLKSTTTPNNNAVRLKRASVAHQSSLHEGSIAATQFYESPRTQSIEYRLNAQRYPGFNEHIYHAFLDQVVKHINEELPQDLLSDLKNHYLLINKNKIRDPRTIKRPQTQQEQGWPRKPSISPEISTLNRQGTVQIPPPTLLEQQIYKNNRLAVPSPQNMNTSNNSRRSPKETYNLI